MGLLNGSVAIVSGSSRGIGQAIVQRFGEEGASIVVNSRSSIEEGQHVASSLPDAIYVQADVSKDDQARSLVEAALARWGRVDIVVNNAGAADFVDERDLDGVTDAVWQRMLD